MIELETKKLDAAEEQVQLGEIVEEVTKAKGIMINGSGLGSVGFSRPDTPLHTIPPYKTPQTVTEGSADAQLLALQQTHTATLADLSNVTAKYRDALQEIQDQLSQLDEVKLSQGLAASEPLERSTRRPVRDMSESPGNRHLFFRHAVSGFEVLSYLNR